jgi:hypothetical protein
MSFRFMQIEMNLYGFMGRRRGKGSYENSN